MEDALYLAAFYDKKMPPELAWRVIRVRMWEFGHSFREIDEMTVEDLGDILAYWHEKARIEQKNERIRKRKASRGKR